MKIDDYPEFDRPMPAVLIGHEVSEFTSELEAIEERPPWLTWWQHQHGGYACLQMKLAGILAPLEAVPSNVERAEVIATLQRLGKVDPPRRASELPEELRKIAPTAGRSFKPVELATLDHLLACGFTLPRLQGGPEACVEFEAADWAVTFKGWPVLAYEIPMQCHLADPDGPHLIIGKREVTPQRCVDTPLLKAASKFFAALGLSEPLRAHLVWWNFPP